MQAVVVLVVAAVKVSIMSEVVEKLNQIKHKLTKYSSSNQKDAEKVKFYLNQLKKLDKKTNELLEETGLLECLKKLKKKQDPDYSKEADEVLQKLKSACTIKKELTAETVAKNKAKETPAICMSPPLNSESIKKAKLSIDDYKLMMKKESCNLLENETTKTPVTNKKVETSSNVDNKTDKGASSVVPLPDMPLNDILSSLTATMGQPLTTKAANSSLKQQINGTNDTAYSKQPLNGFTQDDDGLSKIFSSKYSRKILYTGRRQVNSDGSGVYQPTKLYDLATRVLVDNLDDLPCRIAIYNATNRFPVAFDLIKGVLERANAKQLKAIEYYSPHLLNDTDYLWRKLSEQDFKKVDDREEDEDETWREYYFRKCDEQEAKFQKVRDNLSRKQANKPKERQTKMATVRFVGSNPTKPINSFSHVKNLTTVSSSETAKSNSAKLENSDPIPIRKFIHDSPGIRKTTLGGSKTQKQSSSAHPAMSQGMKATMKLLKKTIRR